MTDTQGSPAGRPLWAKAGAVVDDDIVRYCAGNDAVLDRILLASDIRATAAHVAGLLRIGALSADEAGALAQGLAALGAEHAEGRFFPGPDDEDGHSAIERELVRRLGPVGKKVHTGRSRNDQVLVAQRLWLKENLEACARHALEAARVCLQRAEAAKEQLLPGYTHLQRAVPSTVGYWFAGHAESFIEDAAGLVDAHGLIDASPLGTAAGYGVNLALDRDGVAEDLGFERLIVNGICAQNGRGKLEAHALAALLLPLGTVRRLAWDLSLFSTSEYALVEVPSRFCTGSSIMPQKRNPDAVEIMRATFAQVAGAHAEMLSVLSLPSGYQRDLQLTKGPLLRGCTAARRTLALVAPLLSEIVFDEAHALACIDAGMLATDRAIELTKAGTPFRDAYQQAAAELGEPGAGGVLEEAARKSIAVRSAPGGPGQLLLHRIEMRLEEVEGRL